MSVQFTWLAAENLQAFHQSSKFSQLGAVGLLPGGQTDLQRGAEVRSGRREEANICGMVWVKGGLVMRLDLYLQLIECSMLELNAWQMVLGW